MMTSIWRRSLAWHVYQLKLLASYALFDCVGDERNVTELNAVGFFSWKVPWLHQIASHLARRLLLMALGGGTAQTAKPSAEWLTEKMWSRLWSFGAGNTSHESWVPRVPRVPRRTARICVLDKLGKGPWYKFANSFKAQSDFCVFLSCLTLAGS
jgi:hypothetical protein